MDSKEKIAILLDLFENHKKGLSLREEFTIAKYDFLVEIGVINYGKEEKLRIFDKAKKEYSDELEDIIYNGTTEESKFAQEYKFNLSQNQLDKVQLKYLQDKAKQLSIITYFDSVDKLEFPVIPKSI